ncbi:hypothetical protein BGW36DRAFT_372338 [Talaromyces proteolyticus]|uniref:Uncharacterized protein n=1 Tax=Talaromyces proteolyticus TaxID=1131652 RepID=A0AAD4Q1D0_9EURO|nr:uncharacterized protein BGW36DRAFT_372338 [Talaromyces proteolyticus]KAH8702154.1 hypothetical protein BGW36DRAFT_372338 [Talaromyces proteolyticus]
MASSSSIDKPSDQNPESCSKPFPPSTRPSPEEQNPFIAFRRYADEQISSMLQSVMGLPSMMSSPQSNRWLHFEEESHQRLRKTGEDGEQHPDGQSNGRWSNRQWRNKHDDEFSESWNFLPFSFKLADSFIDDRSPFGFGGSFFPENMLFGGDSQTWAVPYILFSPYSPLQLERPQGRGSNRGIFSSLFTFSETELDSTEPLWRDAFEDLLRLENGQPMLDPSTKSDRNRKTGKEWLQGMIQRGSISNNWKLSPYGISFKRSQQYNNEEAVQGNSEIKYENRDENETSEPQTELDLYDRFLDDISSAHERYSRAFADSPLMRLLEEERKRHLEQAKVSGESNMEKTKSKDWLEYTANGNKEILDSQYKDDQSSSEPRVVLTSTRTVRRTQPDGSVSTRTIKTRRFTDGREESDETEELIPPPAEKSTKQNGSSNAENNDDDGKPTGGWFWTR